MGKQIENKLKINLIWCQSENNVIGQFVNNKYIIPWSPIKEDMQNFRKLTTGNGNNAILMGYNTYLSLDKKPLPNRQNFVLTRKHYNNLNVLFDSEYNVNLFTAYKTFDGVINACLFLNIDELWIIGGGSIYEMIFKEHLQKINKIYRTIIPKQFSTDSNSVLISEIPNCFIKTNETILDNCKIECFESI